MQLKKKKSPELANTTGSSSSLPDLHQAEREKQMERKTSSPVITTKKDTKKDRRKSTDWKKQMSFTKTKPNGKSGSLILPTTTSSTDDCSQISLSSPVLPKRKNSRALISVLQSGSGIKEKPPNDEDTDSLIKRAVTTSGSRKTKTLSSKKISKLEMTEDEGDIVRDFKAVYHKKMSIHHGRMYIFPKYVGFLSGTALTRVRIAFEEVLEIKLNPMSITIVTTAGYKTKKHKFSHLYFKNRTYKVLKLVWAHSKGNQAIDLDELRHQKFERDLHVSEIRHLGHDIPDEDHAGKKLGDDVQDESIDMPPTGVFEKPESYDEEPLVEGTIALSLPKVWLFFLSNEATLWSDVHIKKGDRVLEISPWEPTEEGYLQRKVVVDMDLKSKFFKGVCHIESIHQCYALNNSQFVIKTNTSFEGVPYSKEFHTEEYWEFSSIDDGSTKICVWGEVPWSTKGPWFKGMIDKSSIAGIVGYSTLWISEANQALWIDGSPPDAEEGETEAEKNVNTIKETSGGGGEGRVELRTALLLVMTVVAAVLALATTMLWYRASLLGQHNVSLADENSELKARLAMLEGHRSVVGGEIQPALQAIGHDANVLLGLVQKLYGDINALVKN